MGIINFMNQHLNMPTMEEAAQMMAEAEQRNPGRWVQHSVYVAQAASQIAAHHPALDPSTAYILGYLHDIGRREGVTDLRHTLDGYNYLAKLGFTAAARVCLTHCFPTKSIYAGAGQWDCTPAELEFVRGFMAEVEFSEYDRLILLCDALALPTGYCLIEKRLVDIALRRGVNDQTVEKWKAFFELQGDFERIIGRSIYSVLPGVIEYTFGMDLGS
jgi:hypothetical protein